MSGRPWTDDEDETVRLNYANYPTFLIAFLLGRSDRAVYQRALDLGLKKSREYLAGPHAWRWDGKRGGATRFKPGHASWNKGRKGWRAGGRSAETRFRPGQMPTNHKPVGYERVNADGYRERKVAEPKTFRAVHVLLWQEHLGPVPQGFAVIFKNGNKADIRIDNLALVSRADLMRRNSYHNRYPKEIALAIQLKGALQRQINKRERAA
jgi:hypothetical protein